LRLAQKAAQAGRGSGTNGGGGIATTPAAAAAAEAAAAQQQHHLAHTTYKLAAAEGASFQQTRGAVRCFVCCMY
jgi:hypothetical protein